MGEPKNPHVHDVGTFGRVPGTQNKYYLSLETPGHLNKSKKTQINQNLFFRKINILEIRNLENGKDVRRQIPTIRLIISCTSWMWDQYLPENMKWEFRKSLKL